MPKQNGFLTYLREHKILPKAFILGAIIFLFNLAHFPLIYGKSVGEIQLVIYNFIFLFVLFFLYSFLTKARFRFRMQDLKETTVAVIFVSTFFSFLAIAINVYNYSLIPSSVIEFITFFGISFVAFIVSERI